MTKVVRLWEVCASAETKVENLLDSVLDVLHEQNQRLVQLQEEIRKSQPMESGSIGLELHPCSKKGCKGCPHGRWVKYVWKQYNDKPDQLLVVKLDSARRDPILSLKRKHPSYKVTARLIREAKTILSNRAKLMASLRALEYAAKLR